MWPFVRRGILPGLLLIGGLVSLIYGSRFHFVPVLTKKTTEKTIDVPVPFSQIPPPFPGDQGIWRTAAIPQANRTKLPKRSQSMYRNRPSSAM